MELQGLTDNEVCERISEGEVNSVEQVVSRTYKDIVTKNVFTVLNMILFSLGAMLLYMGELVSAFAATGIIIMNVLIATVQEIRAKKRLDKIALLMRPRVAVLRNGVEAEIDQAEIVKDDLIFLRGGDQALVDGVLLKVRSLEVDESLLTGESRTVKKKVDDIIYSGSYCVTGDGYYRVTAFGEETFAAKMLASAKEFNNKQSPLQTEVGILIKTLMVIAMIYLAVMVLINVLDGNSLRTKENLEMAVIILDIVPIGLFLMIVIAYVIAAVRMSDSGILLQRANAVESMSHVDTVCMDKTGTITTNRLVFKELMPFVSAKKAERYAVLFASATGSRNKTVDAILNEYGEVGVKVIDEILFSSERKYSGVKVEDEENGEVVSLVLGAYSVLSKKMGDSKGIKDAIKKYTLSGLRTVVLAKADGSPFYKNDNAVLSRLEPVAVIAIQDEVRPDCKMTMDTFIENGIEIRIISGDDPEAVGAMFTIAGLPGEKNLLSGDELEQLEGEERTRRILEANIFGRMKPDHKEQVIKELKMNGRYVAMVGDGVNDVKSLKEANVGVALQSGSGAARGVADMVLMSDDFSALPKALMEGNRTVSGMRDILKIYLVRNFVIAMMVLLITVMFHAPPLLPITSMAYAFLSLSIISFFMIIWAKPSKIEGSILPEVLKYAVPTATFIGLFGLLTYCIFYFGELHGVFESIYGLLGFAYAPFSSLGTGEAFIKGIEHFGWGLSSAVEAEIFGRNALLVFLMVAGILQVLMVSPRLRQFSVDGKICKDPKPTIMVFLILILMFLTFYAVWAFPELTDPLKIFILPLPLYMIIIAIILLWLYVNRLILRRNYFGKMISAAERMHSRRKNKSAHEERDQ